MGIGQASRVERAVDDLSRAVPWTQGGSAVWAGLGAGRWAVGGDPVADQCRRCTSLRSGSTTADSFAVSSIWASPATSTPAVGPGSPGPLTTMSSQLGAIGD